MRMEAPMDPRIGSAFGSQPKIQVESLCGTSAIVTFSRPGFAFFFAVILASFTLVLSSCTGGQRGNGQAAAQHSQYSVLKERIAILEDKAKPGSPSLWGSDDDLELPRSYAAVIRIAPQNERFCWAEKIRNGIKEVPPDLSGMARQQVMQVGAAMRDYQDAFLTSEMYSDALFVMDARRRVDVVLDPDATHLDPDSDDRAWALYKVGRKKEAIAILAAEIKDARLTRVGANCAACDCMAKICQDEGKTAEAKAWWKEARVREERLRRFNASP